MLPAHIYSSAWHAQHYCTAINREPAAQHRSLWPRVRGNTSHQGLLEQGSHTHIWELKLLS